MSQGHPNTRYLISVSVNTQHAGRGTSCTDMELSILDDTLLNPCRESRRKAELKEKYAKLRAQEGEPSAPLSPEQSSG